MQLNPFSSWLFNVMLWGGIFALIGLSYQAFVHPIITGLTAAHRAGRDPGAVAVLAEVLAGSRQRGAARRTARNGAGAGLLRSRVP